MLLGQFLWDLFNQRPAPQLIEPTPGQELTAYTSGNGPFTIAWTRQQTTSQTTSCNPPGLNFEAPVNNISEQSIFVFAKGIRIGTTSGASSTICGTTGGVPNDPKVAISTVLADGGGQDLIFVNDGGVFPSSFFNRQNTSTDRVSNIRILVGGNTINATTTGPGEETTARPQAPRVPTPVPIPRLPGTAPATQPQPAQVPDEAQPVPAPAAPPAPGLPPAVAPARPALPGRAPSPVRQSPQTGAGAQAITAAGPRPQLPPAPQPTNTGTTFLPGGRPLVPNGPPPTMEGIATELGKLEQKLEIMLNPDDTLSPLELLNKVIDQVENIEFLIERLFPPEPYRFDAGSYQLAPICDRDAEGELVPPLEAPWAGGEGEFTELRQRLDALAQLIQHHKTLKQPACGGRGGGPHSNVTVHFESP